MSGASVTHARRSTASQGIAKPVLGVGVGYAVFGISRDCSRSPVIAGDLWVIGAGHFWRDPRAHGA